jgi:hypothetical protein
LLNLQFSMDLYIGPEKVLLSGIASLPCNSHIEADMVRPGSGPNVYDPFCPPRISSEFSEYGRPWMYDPGIDLSRLQRSLKYDPMQFTLDSVCPDFFPNFDAAKSAGETYLTHGRIALVHFSGFGSQAFLFADALIEAKRNGLHAGYVLSGILSGQIVSFRTGRTALDSQPYWELCCFDPFKGEF